MADQTHEAERIAVQTEATAQAEPTSPEAGAADLLDQLRRERADFLNYRRRVDRELVEERERAQAQVLSRFFPLIEELDRALSRLPSELETNPWARGVALSRHRLLDAFAKLGVERIGMPGEQFDPARHEAISYETRADVSDRRVAEVVRAGYRLGDRLLQPAVVGVVGPIELPATTESTETTGIGEERRPVAGARAEGD